jgi:hypothetical protein
MDGEYYTTRKPALLQGFDEEAQTWGPVLAARYGEALAKILLQEAREAFEALLPLIPYIGGDENPLTGSLVESAWCLALYRAMQKHGGTVEETGKVLYDAALAQREVPEVIPPQGRLTAAQLMERRRRRAERSQERRFPQDYVYAFVEGDGEEFDYGYDFQECGALKFYHSQDADAFTPFYCYLDFPKSRMELRRSMTLSEGDPICNHRFRESRKTIFGWPPPFLKKT